VPAAGVTAGLVSKKIRHTLSEEKGKGRNGGGRVRLLGRPQGDAEREALWKEVGGEARELVVPDYRRP
jgi:hypothetical protein